jgi:hypothetical protein
MEMNDNINLEDNNNKFNIENNNYNNNNNNNNNRNTLNEPILTTISNDFKNIIFKTKQALIPFGSDTENSQDRINKFRDWDLWGPLIFCLLLGLILSIGRSNVESSGIVFILIFVIVWIGGLIVSFNSQFLGVNLSCFQCICILGYCMFAIVVAAFINLFLSPVFPTLVMLIVSFCAGVYCTFSASRFIGVLVNENKKYLVSYPIGLFYFFLAWFTVAK